MIRNRVRQDHDGCRAQSGLAPGMWAGGGHQESQRGMCRRQTAEEAIRAQPSAGAGGRSCLGQEQS